MKHASAKLLLFAMILIMQACGGSATEPPPETQIVVIEPEATIDSSPTEIVHTVIPVNPPGESSRHAADQDSAKTSGDFTAPGGDRFTYGEYERPFNAVAMDKYFPDLDIQFYEIYQDETWTYISITVRSQNPEGKFPGQYALEIDNDIDGKGDWLIIVSNPSSTEWTTDNVQVWQDVNKDVGGTEPIYQDKAPGFIDGYETKVFDSGVGDDADAAWVRISPNNQLVIQIAVKSLLIDDDGKFLAGPWAGTVIDPAKFDHNDNMTPEEAGAAVKTFTLYPIQFLAEIDNACRVPVGLLIASPDLNLCEIFEPTPAAGEEKTDPGNACVPVDCGNYPFNFATCSCPHVIP